MGTSPTEMHGTQSEIARRQKCSRANYRITNGRMGVSSKRKTSGIPVLLLDMNVFHFMYYKYDDGRHQAPILVFRKRLLNVVSACSTETRCAHGPIFLSR